MNRAARGRGSVEPGPRRATPSGQRRVPRLPRVPGRILIDVSPLRESRDFRLLFFGQIVGSVGSQLTLVAIPYQVYAETHSSLQVGAVSLAQLVPLIVGALVGGSVGDAVDRRTLLLVASAALALTSAALAVNSLVDHPSLAGHLPRSAPWPPASPASSPPPATRPCPPWSNAGSSSPAYAFIQIIFQVGTVVGPALSGLLIAAIGLPWVYGIDALTYGVTHRRPSP